MSDRKKVLVGFDGSVDRTVRPIQVAGNPNRYFATIGEYGRHIVSKAGLSCSIQNEIIKSQAGGNNVFVAQSLNAQGYDVFLAGLFGENSLTAEFLPLAEKGIELCSFGDNQFCECYEFDDGKIMISPQISDMPKPFEKLSAAMSDNINLFHEADLIAMLNWGEIPWMQQLWDDAAEYMFTGEKADDKFVFFDPADMSCRADDEIKQMLQCMKKASKARHCALSINENETLTIGKAIYNGESRPEVILESLVNDGYVNEVVMHTLYRALAFDGKSFAEAPTDHVEKPLFSTGAGDNFNGGYCSALLQKCSLVKRIKVANRAAHHFITTGTQAGLEIFE